jgi:hypothetical protein
MGNQRLVQVADHRALLSVSSHEISILADGAFLHCELCRQRVMRRARDFEVISPREALITVAKIRAL